MELREGVLDGFLSQAWLVCSRRSDSGVRAEVGEREKIRGERGKGDERVDNAPPIFLAKRPGDEVARPLTLSVRNAAKGKIRQKFPNFIWQNLTNK